MILYKVSALGVSAFSVKRETKEGWTEHSNGRIKRNVLLDTRTDHWLIKGTYYTTKLDEAKKWHSVIYSAMTDIMQHSRKTMSNIDYWVEDNDMDEDVLPDRSWNA